MPPRKRRQENRGLPTRWRYTHGAYYYQVPPGQEHQWDGKRTFRLGKTLTEAYKTWSERLELRLEASTIGDLLDRYAHEVVPTKAPSTHADQLRACQRLRRVFGHMPIDTLKPVHVYRYLDQRGQKARTAAIREVEVLSHAYTKAICWGLTDHHPIKGKVTKPRPPARTRYVEDWEIIEALRLPARRRRGSVRMIQAYIRIKLLTGLRRGDMLRLRMTDMKEDGIHVQPRKTAGTTGKRLIIEWSDELRSAVEDAKAARPVDIAPWLFCTRRGACYVSEATGNANGWDSLWQRFMARLLAETAVSERFTEHDLRAKAGSDEEDLERARQLLAHASAATTKRIYRRRPEVVKPGRGVKIGRDGGSE